MNYRNFLGQLKEAVIYWEIQAAQMQDQTKPLWVTEFDPAFGEFYV